MWRQAQVQKSGTTRPIGLYTEDTGILHICLELAYTAEPARQFRMREQTFWMDALVNGEPVEGVSDKERYIGAMPP